MRPGRAREPFGTPCRDRYTAGGADQLQARIAATGPKVAAVVQAVRAAAPNARIVVVGYPVIVPDSGYGCWPVVPFAYGDVPYLRTVAKSLNSMLAQTATAGGAEYADTYTPSIGRDVCRGKSVRWVEGVVPENPPRRSTRTPPGSRAWPTPSPPGSPPEQPPSRPPVRGGRSRATRTG